MFHYVAASSIGNIIYPLVMIILLAIWSIALVIALKAHRPWHWILILTFLPIVSVPFYVFNFHVFGGGDDGLLDKNVRQLSRIAELKKKVEELDLLGDIQELAVAYFENQNYREALRYFQVALDKDPEDLKCQYLTGVSLLAISEGERALPHFEYVLDEDARYLQGEVRLSFAKALLNAGHTDRAKSEFERAASHFNLPEASVRAAQYLVEEKRLEEARQMLVEMLKSVGELQSIQRRAHQRWIKQATDDLQKINRLIKEKQK